MLGYKNLDRVFMSYRSVRVGGWLKVVYNECSLL